MDIVQEQGCKSKAGQIGPGQSGKDFHVDCAWPDRSGPKFQVNWAGPGRYGKKFC